MTLRFDAPIRPRAGLDAARRTPTREFKFKRCSMAPGAHGVPAFRHLARNRSPMTRGRRRPSESVATAAAAVVTAAGASTVTVLNTLKVAFVTNPIGFMTSLATCIGAITFAVLLVYAIPALVALRRTLEASEILFESLQDELPDTLAAVRLSGLELTDAIEEVSGLGSDLSAGLRASARALVGAESGVREGAQIARELVKDGTPLARRSVERALLKRSKLNYSEGTVASVAQGAKVASKRLRFALAAANAANWGAAMVDSGRRRRDERYPYNYPDQGEEEES